MNLLSLLQRFIACYLIKRELERNLAARKTLRPYRQQAALKGWQQRKAH